MSPEVNDAVTVLLIFYVIYLRMSITRILVKSAAETLDILTAASKEQVSMIREAVLNQTKDQVDAVVTRIDFYLKKMEEKETPNKD